MDIYDEITGQKITDPDLSAGYLYDGVIVTGRVEEHIQVMEGTVTADRPDGLRRLVPARDITEPCRWYHTYTEEDKQAAVSDKLSELSSACNAAITAGADVQLSDGSTARFSYSLEDQSNVSEMFNSVLMGATSYPYHANGENCRMYSAADITAIYLALSSLKTGQTTYYNQLRQYVQTLETVPKINAVKYGDALAGEYLETYNTLLTQAQTEMQKILAKVTDDAG